MAPLRFAGLCGGPVPLGASGDPGDGVPRSRRRAPRMYPCVRRPTAATSSAMRCGGSASSRDPHPNMHQLRQRPLVVRQGRHSRYPARQRSLRGLPLPRRCTARRRPAPTRSRGPDGVGVVTGAELAGRPAPSLRNGPRLLPRVGEDAFRAISPDEPGVKASSITYSTGSTAFTAPSHSTISKKMPSRVLVWKSMSKTKLPSEWTTTADPAIS